ncbi:MAG TPA: hypothetical protein VGK54_14405 [Chloroflexota bacterium]
MGRRPTLRLMLALSSLLLTLSVVPGAAAQPLGPTHPPALPSTATSHVPVCPGPVAPGTARCHAILRTDGAALPSAVTGPSGYWPTDLQSAYKMPVATDAGTGFTIGIVDAYDDPTAESDLAVYRSQFGLSPCTTANGCFKKVNQAGVQGSYPSTNGGWAQEISLDLDMASALCPNCHILLVEATTNSLTNLGTAVNTAASMGANVISNSYGTSEFLGETNYEAYYNHPGVAVTVSSGDSGYGVEFPAASRYVTAVGGTHLTADTNSRGWSETAWSGAGSGCSAYVTKPSWQTDSGCPRRTVADVSAVADPNTGVAVYDSTPSGGSSGWLVFGGTSVASPIISAVYALAGNAPSSTTLASLPYLNPSALFDVTSGSNGACGGSYMCTAGASYDGPTGLGTPNGTGAFKSLVATVPDFTISANPSSQSVTAGSSTSYPVTLAALNGYGSLVNLSASGLPTGATAVFNPPAVTPASAGTTSTLTITSAATTPAGTSTLTITGTGTDTPATIHSTNVTLVVSAGATPPDFTISASPGVRNINAGRTTTYTVSLTASNGYSSPVGLVVTGLPAGAVGSFTPNPVTPTSAGASSTLTITTTASTPKASYTLTITGTGSDSAVTTHADTVSLRIR